MSKSVVGGALIGIGCLAYASVQNKVLGAFLFSIGLLTICIFEFDLFTGKLCYKTDKKDLIKIFIGNFIGAFIIGVIGSRMGYNIDVTAKLETDVVSVIIKGILCNVMIGIAVISHKRLDGFIKYFMIILSVVIFILCGFEHSIANIGYMTMAGQLGNILTWRFLIFNVFGNVLGGLLVRTIMERTGKDED